MCRFFAFVALLCCITPADAQRIRPNRIGAQGVVGLPYTATDLVGEQWMIYQAGRLQQQGNQPLYSQGARIQINGNEPNMQNNNARIDDETGEVVFDSMNANNVLVTRRILFDPDQCSARYIDVLKNPQQQEVVARVEIRTSLNYGINAAETMEDPKRKDQKIAWVGLTGAGRSVVEMFAGKGAPVAPEIQWQQGSNDVRASFDLTIPAGKEVAIMHFHVTIAGQEAGMEFVNSMNENKLMTSLPRELRSIIVNFRSPQTLIGDYEILRGELFDVVELRGGDQMSGTIREPAYKLATFYGAVDLPVDRVIGLINVGIYRPRQLLVTVNGEVFGGSLEKQTIDLEMSSGQVVQVPLGQITRMGYRKRAGEPEEWKFTRPFVAMRAGDRIGVQMPDAPMDVLTRYGKLSLNPGMISSIAFQAESHGVHEITLIDGSRFAGLVVAEQFEMALADAPHAKIAFPASSVSRMQFVAAAPEIDAAAPTLTLGNGDLLVCTLTGELKLDASFDTITVNATEIRELTRGVSSTSDVQVTLWDETKLSGQLQSDSVKCLLASGVEMTVPIPLVERYLQPRPQPSAGMVQRIHELVVELNADDWKQRDRAESQLVAMGTAVIGVLKQTRDTQPPEAQQRIDSILKKVEAAEKK